MGSVLQRTSPQGSDGAHSSSHTQSAPHSASPHSISQSFPSRQQGNQSTSPAYNTSGYVQEGNHGFEFTSEQSSALALPHGIKLEGLSLNPEQRARMEYHKAMALARRKEKLEQQNHQKEELLLNWFTPVQTTLSSQQYNPVQSTLSSQQDNHLRSTLSSHRANHGGTAFMSTYSSPSSLQDVYRGSTLELTNRHFHPSHQDIYGVATLAFTHSAQYLQHGSADLHQDMYGSSTLISTHDAHSSQQDKHTPLVSIHSSLPLWQNNQGGLTPTSVQNPSSLQQGSYGSLACEREKTLAKRKKQDHYLSETGTSQCTIADGSTNFLLQRSYQHGGSSHVPVELSFSTPKQEDGGFSLTPAQRARIARQRGAAIERRKKRLQQDAQLMPTQCSAGTIVKSSLQEHLATSWFTNHFVKPPPSLSHNGTQDFSTPTFSQQPQDSYREPSSNYVQDLHHRGSSLTSVQSPALSQQDTYSGASLTQEQRARMAHQKETAIARRNTRLRHQQQDEHYHAHLTSVRCLASSQQDPSSGTSLTQEQRARMAHQKEMPISRRNRRLRHQQQDEHYHAHLTSVQCLASSQQDPSSGSSLTQEQRARMARQKEMAIARHNARLRQQQQDEHQNMYHEQGISPRCMELQEFATSLFTNYVADGSQSASNQENDVSMFLQESHISSSPHQRISSQQDGDDGFSFTPVESSLSSQEGSSFLALTHNGHLASSRETFSLCSQSALANSQQDCASILSMDHAAKCFQSLAPIN